MSEIENSEAGQVDTEVGERPNAIIEVEHLTKRFGDVTAVEDASFAVRDGEFFSIIGPSGSGKTTLLRMLAGFGEPSRGIVRIEGRDVTYDKPHRRSTNMIFQNLALFPHLDVEGNIAYGLVESGADRETIDRRVRDVLETVDLAGYQERGISELSGGEQQRVALARGLVTEPSVLLLDEPLASLDEKLKESMKVELKRIQDRTNTTFIYVTHDQEVAIAMSDRIAILNEGVIQQIDSPQELYTNPANRFVADFTGAHNIFRIELLERDGTEAVVGLGDLEIRARLSDRVTEGNHSDLHLVIRPETIDVLADGGLVTGTISDLVYKGALAEVIVDTVTGGQQLEFQAEVHYDDVESFAEGEEVSLRWGDTSGLVVRAE